ncbi:MAG: T9SS type A sorting domain-containing protein [Cytophagaceae bacterium]|nr:T9SS type A sorting domain-containing protein [Cytophagaceae bacterium]MDW8455450.1 T9SS type A sorting domain-containing protein [Cytophagaceae bacterium]
MKKNALLFTLLFASIYLHSQQIDLSIKYTNYQNGQYIGYGNILTEFIIVNHGPTNLYAGDTILLAARFNHVEYDMYLTKRDSVTLWKLTNNLLVGDTLRLNPGYLIGWMWARHSLWSVPDGSLTLTLVVYGAGLASWKNNFANDPNPANNLTYIIYKNVDLSVKYNLYQHNEVTNNSILYPSFTIYNHGPTDVKAGETIYMRTRINGTLYSLSLVPGDTTKYNLTSDFKVGDSIVINPGYLDAALTAGMLGASTLDVEILVYGVMKASVHPTFRTDGKPSDNIVKVTYNPAIKDDLTIKYQKYSNGQYVGYGNIQTKFYVINKGPTNIHAGDTLYLAARLNNQVYDLSLNTPNGVTKHRLTKTLKVGDTLTIDPGYLTGHLLLHTLSLDSVKITLMVYGKGASSHNPTYSKDATPADNEAFITYKNVNLDIKLNHYTPNAITQNATLQMAYSITNYGPVTIKAGEKLYLQVKLNNALFDLNLNPGAKTILTLSSDLPVGQTLSVNPGSINAQLTAQILGSDTLKATLILYGFEQSPLITGNPFATDSDSSNNKATVTYRPNTTDVLSGVSPNNGVSVYPLPADNNLTFYITETSAERIVVNDLNGKTIAEWPVSSELNHFDVSTMPKGMYVYRVYSSNQKMISNGKFILK